GAAALELAALRRAARRRDRNGARPAAGAAFRRRRAGRGDADRRRWHDFRGGAARAAARPSRRDTESGMSLEPQRMMRISGPMQAEMARAQEALAAERIE